MKNTVEPRTLSGFMELMPQDQILFDKIKNVIEELLSWPKDRRSRYLAISSKAQRRINNGN